MVFEFNEQNELVATVNGGVLSIRFDFGKNYPIIVTLGGKTMRYKSIDKMLKAIGKYDCKEVKKPNIVKRIIGHFKRKEKDGTKSGK